MFDGEKLFVQKKELLLLFRSEQFVISSCYALITKLKQMKMCVLYKIIWDALSILVSFALP